jgi:hypothetical protein
VSVITKSVRDDRIARVRSKLRNHFGTGRIIPHCLNVSLADPKRNGENTQRFRTILSIVAGLTVAAAEGSDELEIFENGIGILNLPAPNIQLTHESSQVLSPGNAAMWRDVSKFLLGTSITIRYPFRWYTKAELCLTLDGELLDLIAITRSCDGEHRILDEGLLECGACGSCLSRKAAIAEARIDSTLDAPYRQEDTGYHHGIDVAAVYRLHQQTLRRSLSERYPWQELTRIYPSLRTSLGCDDHGAVLATINLLTRYYYELSRWLTLPHAA